MSEKATFNPDAPDRDTYVTLKEMDLNSGMLGKFFGTSGNVSVYIAGVVVFLTAVTGLIVTLTSDGDAASETWKHLTPIMTMILGFLFGKNSSD